jgi:hypothetical protein
MDVESCERVCDGEFPFSPRLYMHKPLQAGYLPSCVRSSFWFHLVLHMMHVEVQRESPRRGVRADSNRWLRKAVFIELSNES